MLHNHRNPHIIPVRDGYYVRYFYSGITRGWLVQKMSPEHEQIGEAKIIYGKRQAEQQAAVFSNHTVSWIPPKVA